MCDNLLPVTDSDEGFSVPHEQDHLEKVRLMYLYPVLKGRCRFQLQPFPEQLTVSGPEEEVEDLPRIEQVGYQELVPHVRFKMPQPERKAFRIVLAVLQQPVSDA